jgi:hypothetical protein
MRTLGWGILEDAGELIALASFVGMIVTVFWPI